jgi:hypothetical protein
MRVHQWFGCVVVLVLASICRAEVGDPQVKTDHPWYPGELSCSTFERLFKTQAEIYKRVTGRDVASDEDRAIASWYWRNLNYAHGEEGRCDWFGEGKRGDGEQNRDYWVGLFAHGFGLCGTTHAQYTAEMNALLGHCRSRCVGVEGHNSFEVFLTGGAYGSGRWALLDHDISTVIFAEDGSRLLSIKEIVPQVGRVKDPKFKPERQRNWRVAGLHDDDAGTYSKFNTVEYLAGYAGPPPMMQLRRGESVKRFLEPGLEDGKTFVYWGRNYRSGGVPGPERSRTWVNQPEKMWGSKNGTGYKVGQVRFANAVYEYRPNFSDGSYKEGVVSESAQEVIFSFRTPHVIGCTPANEKDWGIYDEGAKNGLVIEGKLEMPVAVSVDGGKTWVGGGPDLTDAVKGYQQYLLKFSAGAEKLKEANLSWRTVCQTNVATIPHLHDGVNRITFAASGMGLVSAGPTKQQAEAHQVGGQLQAGEATLELSPPRGAKAARIYAASWQASGNPPSASKYRIEYSADGGKSWRDVVKDWSIVRREPEPKDFWSQSFCWGEAAVEVSGPVRVRFTNSQKRSYRKVEAHLAYEVAEPSPTTVTFAWREGNGPLKTASHVYAAKGGDDASWTFDAGREVKTFWVEYSAK